MPKLPLVLALLAASTSVAAAGQVTVTNNTDDTIYKLYAWPTSLSPRTLNIVGFPIFPGGSSKVDVDNAYDDCFFQFETDINNPQDEKKPHHRNKPAKFQVVNLCQTPDKVSLKPDSDDSSSN